MKPITNREKPQPKQEDNHVHSLIVNGRNIENLATKSRNLVINNFKLKN